MDSPQLVDRRPYPKAIFSRADVEADQAENLKDHAVSAEISEDSDNFYLTTTWPSLDAMAAGETAEAPAAPASVPLAAPAAAVAAPAAAVVAAAAEAFTTLTGTNLAALHDEYQRFYDLCETAAAHKSDVDKAANRVIAGKARYQTVSGRLGGHVPWPFIGITHLLEANCNFGRHLHNGDPMMSGPPGSPVWLRTTHKPPNRPAVWPAPPNEPDPWVWSAMDAIRIEGFADQEDWSTPAMLFRFERFNGMGYRQFRNPSPYLWSFSQIYRMGKFDSDGHYSPTLVSDQCGCALVLKAIS
jgi:lysozyme family protein